MGRNILSEALDKKYKMLEEENKKSFYVVDNKSLKESSEEIDRNLFVSLIKYSDPVFTGANYGILNDGNFVTKFWAESDEEAKEKFNELCKRHMLQERNLTKNKKQTRGNKLNPEQAARHVFREGGRITILGKDEYLGADFYLKDGILCAYNAELGECDKPKDKEIDLLNHLVRMEKEGFDIVATDNGEDTDNLHIDKYSFDESMLESKEKFNKLSKRPMLQERNLTKAERHNRNMDRIFKGYENGLSKEKEFLLAHGVSPEEVEELYWNTGLHGDALRQKIIDMGLDKKFRIYAFGVEHQNKLNSDKGLEEGKLASFKDGDEVHEIHKLRDNDYMNVYGNRDGHAEQGTARFTNRKDALKYMHKHRPQAKMVK